MLRIGLISDTHGLLRPEAQRFLSGCAHIVHGGDIGGPAILEALERIAPVTAVRGNNDQGPWAEALAPTGTLRLQGLALFILHDLHQLPQHPPPADTQVIVCGHSHRPLVSRDAAGPLLVNPGSAGPRRFKLPVTAAELLVAADGSCSARVVDLLATAATRPHAGM
jgi:uncharacterized protein